MRSGRQTPGTAVGDVCRQLGISEATFYVWKKRYGHRGCARGAPRPPARGRECAPEAPRRRSDARQAHARGGAPPKRMTPARRRELAGWFQATFQISCRRALRARSIQSPRVVSAESRHGIRPRSGCGFGSSPTRAPRFGYFRIWVVLRREGWMVNRKRVRRLYRLEGLQLRMRVRRRKTLRAPSRPGPHRPRSRGALEHGLRA